MAKIIGVVLSIVVGIFVIGSVLVPIVESSSEVVEPITEYNRGLGHTYREVKAGDVFQLTSVYDADAGKKTDTWTLNGESVINPDIVNRFEWDIGIVSDVMWIEVFASANSSSGIFYQFYDVNPFYKNYVGSSASKPNATFTWEFTEDKILYSNDVEVLPISKEYDYTWAYVPCAMDEGGYLSSSVTTSDVILESPNQYILCGTYSSGDLDANYYYRSGGLTVISDTITGTDKSVAELRSGTYDLYDVNILLEFTDGSITEQFNPYRALVPYEVHGHADSGAAISLLELLPVLAIVSVLLMALSIVVRSRY